MNEKYFLDLFFTKKKKKTKTKFDGNALIE